VFGDRGTSEKLALDTLEDAALLSSLREPKRARGPGTRLEPPERLF
jgi:hypothetical protein